MKVLLVPPTFRYKTQYPAPFSFSDFPTGFGYLAASLKQAGHEVIGLNPNNIPGYPSAKLMLADVLAKKLRETKPDLIGLGGLCTDYAFLKGAISICRGVTPETPIVLGGQIVNNDTEFIYQDLKPDYAVKGDGESIIPYINKAQAPGGICQGIQMGLDNIPVPDYEPFGVQEMLDKHSMDTRLLYRYSRPYARPFTIVASRGCPFSCTFCIDHHRSYRSRSIENIMAEIKETHEKYKYNVLIILDELFAVNRDRMVEFCNAVLKGRKDYGWDFDWTFQTHASAKLNLSNLKLAKEAGCYMFSYGLESASPAVLKSMDKKIKIEMVEEAIDLARQAGIGFSANLIFGDPAETLESWAESLAFYLKYGRDNMIFMTNLMPYPGSKIFNDLKLTDKEKKHYYEHIDEGVPNLTQIHPGRYGELVKLIGELEPAWLFSPLVLGQHERDGDCEKIKAVCPKCHKESAYRQAIPGYPFRLGTGCTHCHQRFSIELLTNC